MDPNTLLLASLQIASLAETSLWEDPSLPFIIAYESPRQNRLDHTSNVPATGSGAQVSPALEEARRQLNVLLEEAYLEAQLRIVGDPGEEAGALETSTVLPQTRLNLWFKVLDRLLKKALGVKHIQANKGRNGALAKVSSQEAMLYPSLSRAPPVRM